MEHHCIVIGRKFEKGGEGGKGGKIRGRERTMGKEKSNTTNVNPLPLPLRSQQTNTPIVEDASPSSAPSTDSGKFDGHPGGHGPMAQFP